MIDLKKSLTAACAAGMVAVSLIAASVPAQAHDDGAIAAGVIGGLALGAIAGSAAPAYGYGYPPPPPAYGGCYLTRQPIYDDYGNFIRYRRVRVCE